MRLKLALLLFLPLLALAQYPDPSNGNSGGGGGAWVQLGTAANGVNTSYGVSQAQNGYLIIPEYSQVTHIGTQNVIFPAPFAGAYYWVYCAVTYTATGCLINTAPTVVNGAGLGSANLGIPPGYEAFLYSDGTSWYATWVIGTHVAANGTLDLGTSAIAAGACTLIQASYNARLDDTITWSATVDITAVTGYAPGSAQLQIFPPFPTPNHLNVEVCNPSAGSITPGDVQLLWKVIR